MKSRSCLSAAGVGFFCLWLVACASSPPPPPENPFREPLPPGVAEARDVVLRVQDTVAEIAQQGSSLSYEKRRAELMAIGLKNFDLPRMAELSYGPGFLELTRAQKKLWIDTFILFRSSASAKVNSRSRGQVYRLSGYDKIAKGDVLIRTAVTYPHHILEISVDYRLADVKGEWKIVDRYSPSAVSEIAMRRSEYRTILEKSGFDGLIEDMNRRIKGYAPH